MIEFTRRSFLTAAAVLPLAACGVGNNPLAGQQTPGAGQSAAPGSLVVGSADFTESRVLAELYAQAMKAKGVEAGTKLGIGSREVYIKALRDGSISVIGEYTGNLLQYLDKGNPAQKGPDIEAALAKAVGSDLAVLKSSQAADQDVYCVTQKFSQEHQVTSLADLKKIAADSVLGGPGELKERPYGPPGLEGIYGAKFKEFRTYDSPAVKVKDLNDNKIQVASFFTTDSPIADNGYVMLTDPQQMILPQQVIPLVRKDVAANDKAVAAIEAVQAALTTADLTLLNKKVDNDHRSPQEVAHAWLQEKKLA